MCCFNFIVQRLRRTLFYIFKISNVALRSKRGYNMNPSQARREIAKNLMIDISGFAVIRYRGVTPSDTAHLENRIALNKQSRRKRTQFN
jgi:hypothetical protein